MELGLLKQIADPAGAHPYKHLHEFRTGDREKGYAGFTSDCFGK